MKHRNLFLFTFLLLTAAVSFAQSNSMIDAYLLQGKALAADTCYLVLVGGALLEESATVEDALTMAMDKGWIKQGTSADSPVTAEEISFLVMRAFTIKGGVMYKLFPNRRYAMKELVARGIVNGSGGKKRIVSGEEAVGIIRKTAVLSTDQKAALRGGVK